MTNIPSARRTVSIARTKAAQATAVPDVQTPAVSRREFLYYIWGASIALLLTETSGAIIWFALPRFPAGEFGCAFTVDPPSLPAKGSVPVVNPAGRYWMSNTNN